MLYWEMTIVLLLILLNGFFAMSELAVVSSRRVRLEQMAQAGRPGAAKALKLASDPTGFLSTVQIGITLIGIFAGAYSGATFAEPLAAVLREFEWIDTSAYPLALALVVLATTYLSLVIGELVPKRIALNNAEAIACFVAGPMTVVAFVGTPIVWFLRLSTETILRLLGVSATPDSTVTEEEVKAMIAEGTETGVFEHAERDMIEGVLRMADRNARSIMVPRRDAVWLSIDDPVDAILDEIRASGHSRFPLCREQVDDVIGVLHVKDLLRAGPHPTREEILAAVVDPLYVNETMPALKLLDRFRGSAVHMAIVLDEYGAFEGIVTPTDILTTIAGDLPEREGDDAPEAVRREDGSWLLDASMAVDSVERILEGVTMEGDVDYATLAGFILDELGHIPAVGESFVSQGWRFEVVDLDGRRIDKVLATPATQDEK
jgi:putative hemolysin